LRVIILVVHVGAVKIYVAAKQALRKKETQDKTQFSTKIGGKKLVWLPVISFCMIFIPSYAFDAMPRLAVLALESPDFTDNSNII